MYRQLVFGAALLFAALGAAGFAAAETIAVIGTGNVGAALGQRFGELGHVVIYGSREPEREDVVRLVAASGADASAQLPEAAVRDADIVVMALPWEVVEEVTRGLGDLTGRIVIDPTNPRSIAEDGLRDYAFDGSNAERVQALAPDASVVKAFSTLGAGTMLDPSIAGGPVSVPIAGDDPDAKAVVADLVNGIGLHAVDVGPLRYAHVIEGMHYLRNNAGRVGESRINFYMPADPH